MPEHDATPDADQEPLRDSIAKEIEALRPFIQRDGGDIEFVELTAEGIVRVRLQGACVGCPGATMTLKFGVEARLKEAIPQVRGVDCVP